MGNFEGIRFKYIFRDYQARALEQLRTHMDDSKLHVVAAPGAGKTILALQVMLELSEPALILAPTVALRQQWIDRFVQDFTGEKSGIISDVLSEPKHVTAATYQSLYSMWTGAGAQELKQALKSAGIRVLILDEAHHLKKAWLDAVSELIAELGDIKTVSLTATPPYDINAPLWNRYIGLCGDIDFEIPIPELVQKGDLAPHQDFIYFNAPEASQIAKLSELRAAARQIFDEMIHNETLVCAAALHKMILRPEENLALALDDFDYYLVLIKYLRCNQIEIPAFAIKDRLLEESFTLRDMETLLSGCLFDDKKSYKGFDDFFREIRRRLNAIGAISKGRVNLRYSAETRAMLTQNRGKLSSVSEIVRFEKSSMGDRLKLVVITDLILQKALELDGDEDLPFIGVVPVFLELYKSFGDGLIVLSGEIVIIPTRLGDKLFELCRRAGLSDDAVWLEELPLRFDYARVLFSAGAQKRASGIITELFRVSYADVMIGSGAYIGEGWDAPFVNTLIMASAISSFVSSNQIRGRAIRTCPGEADKCANIWHLVCVENDGAGKFALGEDYQLLKRRFTVFEGICLESDRIDSGIERMGITDSAYTLQELGELNRKMEGFAQRRASNAASWGRTAKYTYVREFPMSSIAYRETIEPLYSRYFRLRKYLSGLLSRGGRGGNTLPFLGRRSLVCKMGEATLAALIHLGLVGASARIVFFYHAGQTVFKLEDITFKEQQVFTGAFRELMSPLENPRYVLRYRRHCYQVAGLIGKSKAGAEFFAKQIWPRRTPELLYTRTPEGRRSLLEIKLEQKGFCVQWKSREGDEAEMAETAINVKVLQDEMNRKL